jgi:hypothetical protein
MPVKEWIIEGKYTSGLGSEWEEIETVTEEDTGGPGDTLKGHEYGKWLVNEYRVAHVPHPVRIRPKRSTD